MPRWNGGIIGVNNTPTTSVASGVWSLTEQKKYKGLSLWPSAPAGNDAFTKILLHFDGSDASTTITDSNAGGSAHTWTANGNAQLDTGVTPKFGTASLLLDGTGDYVSTPDHADFSLGSGDWTVDFWYNTNGLGAGTNRNLCGQSDSGGTATNISFYIRHNTSNVITAVVYASSTPTTVTATTAFTVAGWHHIAFVRTGNTLKLFVDGVQEGGDGSFSSTVNNSTAAFSIGRLGEITTENTPGLFDEYRLSVGVARWTGNFTPPTVAYA